MSTPGVGAQTNLDFCTRPFNIVCRHLSDLTDVGGRPRGDGKGRERGGRTGEIFSTFAGRYILRCGGNCVMMSGNFSQILKIFFF